MHVTMLSNYNTHRATRLAHGDRRNQSKFKHPCHRGMKGIAQAQKPCTLQCCQNSTLTKAFDWHMETEETSIFLYISIYNSIYIYIYSFIYISIYRSLYMSIYILGMKGIDQAPHHARYNAFKIQHSQRHSTGTWRPKKQTNKC